MKKSFWLLAFLTLNQLTFSQRGCWDPGGIPPFNYLTSLSTYWNYRYHLVGDAINRNQFMPWEMNYAREIGEPGLVDNC